MACSGGYCNYNNTGTSTCSSHQDANWGTAVTLSGNFTAGGLVTASDVTALLAGVNSALNTYNAWLTTYGYTALSRPNYSISKGTTILKDDVNNSETAAVAGNQATFGGYDAAGTATATTVNTGDRVKYTDWKDLYDKYSSLVADCVCNSNCSCNAVCACNNDCGCNYSDIRLKENIAYIETRNGIKLYSFTYIWDKVTKYVGVMAQDLLGTQHANAVSQDANGYYMVNYSKLPI